MHTDPEATPGLVKRLAEAIAIANRGLGQQAKPKWARGSDRQTRAEACSYCATLLNIEDGKGGTTDLLVPLAHGGVRNAENVVPACHACIAARGGRDLLAWLPARRVGNFAGLAEQRLRALEGSANHLTPHSARVSWEPLRAHLRQRWSHPRQPLFVAPGSETAYLGWSSARTSPEHSAQLTGLLRFGCQGELLQLGAMVVIAVPRGSLLDAVWALIELNALVFRLPDWPTPDEQDQGEDWRNAWHLHLPDLASLRRRRPHRGAGPSPAAPSPARSRSCARPPPSARIQDRQQRARQGRLWRSYEEHRAWLEQLWEDQQHGRAAPLSREAWDALWSELDDQCLQAYAASNR